MFEILKNEVFKAMAEFNLQLANCHDIYRLEHILDGFAIKIAGLFGQAALLVEELEDVQSDD